MPPSARVFVRSTTLRPHSAAEDPCARHHACHCERMRLPTHRLARRGANAARRPCREAGLLMFLTGNRATGACAWSIVRGMSQLPLCVVLAASEVCAYIFCALSARSDAVCWCQVNPFACRDKKSCKLQSKNFQCCAGSAAPLVGKIWQEHCSRHPIRTVECRRQRTEPMHFCMYGADCRAAARPAPG
jgi:hypothetical protein